MTTTCEMTERSARGYCPEEIEGHEEELCAFGAEWEDAPFCSGPSDQGVTLIPPLALERDEDGNPVDVSCELDGTCDDGFTDVCVEQGLNFDYETGTCATTVTAATPEAAQTLPEAGVDGVLILVLGIAAIGAGLWTILTR